jgi:hypothetical protein
MCSWIDPNHKMHRESPRRIYDVVATANHVHFSVSEDIFGSLTNFLMNDISGCLIDTTGDEPRFVVPWTCTATLEFIYKTVPYAREAIETARNQLTLF